MPTPRYKLALREDGTAELIRDGEQVWASDSDEDLVDEFGSRALSLEPDDIGDILDYLVDEGYLTDYQADHCYIDPGNHATYPDLEEEDMDEDDEEDDDYIEDDDTHEDNRRDAR
jgi:hypothetical protein